MIKKVLVVSLVLSGITFFQMAGECFAATGDTLDQAKQNTISLIGTGKLAEADTATNKLIADFPNSPGIDEAVHQIALKYQDVKNYQKEIELSRLIIKNWPDSERTIWSQMDIVMSYVALNDESAAQAEVKTLLSSYKDDPNLPLCSLYHRRLVQEGIFQSDP